MPTSYAVLDSGILLATVQAEKHTQKAVALIANLAKADVQIIAPTLLAYEIIAVTRKWVHREILSKEKADDALKILMQYPVTHIFDTNLLRRAYELANQFNRPTAYDTQYLAIAEQYKCPLWTADKRLFNAVNTKFSDINWIGDYAASD